MADPKQQVKLPGKKPYRVVVVGATYLDPVEAVQPDGSLGVTMVYRIGRFGEVIDLTDLQASRLLDLGVIKDADAPLTYSEMNGDQLKGEVKARGLSVAGSGANGAAVNEDYVRALETYDQGRGVVAPAAPAVSAI